MGGGNGRRVDAFRLFSFENFRMLFSTTFGGRHWPSLAFSRDMSMTDMAEPRGSEVRRNVRAMRPHIDGGVSDLFRSGALAVRAMNTELTTRSIDTTQGVQPRMLNRLAAPGTAVSRKFPERTPYASMPPGTS